MTDTSDPISAAVAPGYAFEGPALELGGLMVDATTLGGVPVRIPLGMLNRHGLVAGATGTGKTKTLQLLAEQLSAPACRCSPPTSRVTCPASRPRAGEPKITERAASVGQEWQARVPGGALRARRPGHGTPLRVTMSAFGPTLLSKVLGSTTPRSPRSGWCSTTPTRPACRCSTSPTCARSSST